MSKLLTKDDLNFWANKDNFGPFIKVNPRLETNLEELCTTKEELILVRMAARAFINQPNNEKTPSLMTITNKRLLIHRVKSNKGFMINAIRDKMLGHLGGELVPADISDIIDLGGRTSKALDWLGKNKTANKELQLYEELNSLPDDVILDNKQDWKVLFEAEWSQLKNEIKEVSMGNVMFQNGTKITFKPLKEKFFSTSKYPTISFVDEGLETCFLEFVALFDDFLPSKGISFKVQPEPAYAFKMTLRDE